GFWRNRPENLLGELPDVYQTGTSYVPCLAISLLLFRKRDQRFGQVRDEDELVWSINGADHVRGPAVQRSVKDSANITQFRVRTIEIRWPQDGRSHSVRVVCGENEFFLFLSHAAFESSGTTWVRLTDELLLRHPVGINGAQVHELPHPGGSRCFERDSCELRMLFKFWIWNSDRVENGFDACNGTCRSRWIA